MPISTSSKKLFIDPNILTNSSIQIIKFKYYFVVMIKLTKA